MRRLQELEKSPINQKTTLALASHDMFLLLLLAFQSIAVPPSFSSVVVFSLLEEERPPAVECVAVGCLGGCSAGLPPLLDG